MDYKEKYEDALNRAKIINPGTADYEVAVKIFPELESEGERIKKSLIEHIKGITSWNYFLGISKEQMLAWLEKQGEQKSTDKVESKFKAGNWYLCVKDFFGKGVRFDKGHTYYCGLNGCLQEFDGGAHIAIVENLYDIFNLWTIKDAKDGDVLAYNDGHGNDCIELIKSITDKKIEFWFCLTNGNRYEVFDRIVPYTNLASREDATPATKEQRDLLFQKMKESGYEWDAEKKELKKIEQKPAWSEEDEKERKRVVGLLEGWLSTFKETCYAEDCKCGIAWLKTLKQRMKGE